MLTTSLLPLRSDRAVLRAMRPDDAAAYAGGTEDPDVRRYGHLPHPEYTEDSVLALLRGPIREGLEQGDLAVLAIADPSTDEFAGSLVLFDATRTSVEVGFWIHPDHRGRRLSAAALALAAELARRSGITRMTARTMTENTASQRSLERSGFVCGGPTQDIAPSGETVVLLHYERLLSDDPATTMAD